MLDPAEFDRWWRASEDARSGARAQQDVGLHHWACFLAEQAAQLGLKALLKGIGSEAWGHDLVDLSGRVASELDQPLEPGAEAALRRLGRHYIPARYPDAHAAGDPGQHYGETDSDQALADVETIQQLVEAWWGRLSDVGRP